MAHPSGLQSAAMVMKVVGKEFHPCFILYFFLHFRGELLSLRDIERLHKKPKSDKETRLATAMVSEAHGSLVL